MILFLLVLMTGLMATQTSTVRFQSSDREWVAEGVDAEKSPRPLANKPADFPLSNPFGRSGEESYAGKVVIIEVRENDLSHGQSFKFWERTLERLEEEEAEALIFDLETPGGLAFPTKDLMSKIANLEIPTYSYIDPMAMSAGALIAVSTDEIYMAPGSLVGSAALVSGSGMAIDETMRAKIESFFDAHVRWITEKKGHRYEVIEAMMMVRDEERKVGSITVPKGGLMALNSSEAVEMLEDGPLFAQGEVKDLDALLKLKGYERSQVVIATPTGFEKFAWWVASASGFLILLGLGGGYLELKTPGFGIGGIISLTAFSLFFFGNYVAGRMAGYELAALFVLGIVLILIEIFLVPGVGVVGFLGLGCVLSALGFAMVDRVQWQKFQWDQGSLSEAIAGPALQLAIGIFGSLILLYLIIRYLPTVPLFERAMLTETLASGTGQQEAPLKGHVGAEAVTATDLRPAGKISLEGALLDASLESGFLRKGEKVTVVREDGMGITVRAL